MGVQLISGAFEYSVCICVKFMLWKMQVFCIEVYVLWDVQTINFPYTHTEMFKRP